MKQTPLLLLLFLFLSGSAFAQTKKAPAKASRSSARPTQEPRLNQVQVIGSHNSYKQAMDPALLQFLRTSNPALADAIDYSHPSLSEQLSLGLANLELDLFADRTGGRYAQPKGLEWAQGQAAPFDPERKMQQPGFKILHIQDLDFRSNTLTLQEALQELKRWSDAHPGHHPIFVTMNAKDEEVDKPGFTVPEKFTAAVFDELDRAIREGLGEEKLITPDQVRGQYPTLEQAVLAGNWPTLEAARGKFLFVVDEVGEKRAAFVQGHPSLQGRALFANAEPGTPEAAFLILNDPVRDQQKIRELVQQGYLVRTRADANTKEARTNDKRMFEAALQSGAQIITTDYYRPSTHFQSDYQISFEDGSFIRLHPFLRK